MERKRTYKAGELAKVPASYTSQTCNRCGHVTPRNRITQARFRCVGFMANADHNAAINILGLHRDSVAARPPAQQGPLHSEERCSSVIGSCPVALLPVVNGKLTKVELSHHVQSHTGFKSSWGRAMTNEQQPEKLDKSELVRYMVRASRCESHLQR